MLNTGIDSIDVKFNPPKNKIGESYNLNLVLADLNLDDPQTTEYSIVIDIIELKESSYIVTLDENKEPDSIYEANASEPNMYGEVFILF